MVKNFDFGLNWKDYSAAALDEEKLRTAEESLKDLFQKKEFGGLSFLDVGCGSGIFSVSAKRLGAAEVKGFDISFYSVDTSRRNAEVFLDSSKKIHFEQNDVLDDAAMGKMGKFDLVYAWGSLHHTGEMWHAVENVLGMVKPGGRLVLAIYNRHWTSGAWVAVKKVYNYSPGFIKKILVLIFYALLYVAKLVITRKNPLEMRRGMNFYYDVVDWIGGYPYEYASVKEVTDFAELRGFSLERVLRCTLPTGNNEFLFVKNPA